jgi:multiple sugar transport system substrate-binding protein
MLAGIVLAWAGCGDRESAPLDPDKLPGATMRVSIERGCPLLDAVRVQLGEWQARTGVSVKLEEANRVDPQADVCLVSGFALPSLVEAREIPRAVLSDPELGHAQLPAIYRTVLTVRDGKPVACPLATDMIYLWYRTDLFADENLAGAFKKRFGRPLEVPRTWTEYLRQAQFFQEQGAVKFGCVEAMDESTDGIRNWLARCAAYAKSADWSSFEFDAETGEPRLAAAPFVRGLSEWIEARRWSPAATSAVVTAASARRVFRSGQAAMLLDRLPPTVAPGNDVTDRVDEFIGVAALPGADMVFDPRTAVSRKLDEPSTCIHLATTGWYVVLGTGRERAAAERLFVFLAGEAHCHYLAAAAQHGVIPVQSALLSEPARYHGYRLPAKTTSRLFELTRLGLRHDNWICDLRVAKAPELYRSLQRHLQEALVGKRTPIESLTAAENQWRESVKAERLALRDEYRRSLGLPPIRNE